MKMTKNNRCNQIFADFLRILPGLVLGGSLMCGALPILSAAPQLDIFSDGKGEVLDAARDLRSFARQVEHLRPRGTASLYQLKIVLSSACPPGQLRLNYRNYLWVLTFNPAGLERNYRLLSRIGAVLFAAYGNAEAPLPGSELSNFVAPGWSFQRELNTSCAYLVPSNRHYPVLQTILDCEKFPDLARLLTVSVRELTPAQELWFREFSGAVLYWVEKNHRYSAVGIRPLGDDLPDEELQNLQSKHLEKLVWHHLAPRPVARILSQWQKIAQLKLPEIKEKEQVLFPAQTVAIADLPEQLKLRSDRLQIWAEVAQKLAKLARGVTGQELESLQRLGREARTFAADGAGDSELWREYCELLPQNLARRSEVEKYLWQAEARWVSPCFRLRRTLQVQKTLPETVLTASQRQYFDRIEKLYLE